MYINGYMHIYTFQNCEIIQKTEGLIHSMKWKKLKSGIFKKIRANLEKKKQEKNDRVVMFQKQNPVQHLEEVE